MRVRYQTYSKQHPAQLQAAEEEDDDYEPEYQPMGTLDSAADQADVVSAEAAALEPDLVSLGPFALPKPPPLTKDEAVQIGRDAAARVFDMLASAEAAPKQATGKTQQTLGFARLAGSKSDRDAWAILLIRMATRAPNGLAFEDTDAQNENPQFAQKSTIPDSIRQRLYKYILENFRARLSIGITWLNEEWYSGRIQMKYAAHSGSARPTVPALYERWCLRLLDGIIPYLDSRDTKLFIRFVSEIPEITPSITSRVSSLAKDPERVNLCVQSLLYANPPCFSTQKPANHLSYLIMYRLPAREMCLDTLEDVYLTCKLSLHSSFYSLSNAHKTDEESRPIAGKILAKWRPQKLEQPQQAHLPTDQDPALANGTAPSNPAQPIPQHIRQHENSASSTPI